MPVRGYEYVLAPCWPGGSLRGVGLTCLAALLLALSGSENILSGADPKEDKNPSRPTFNEIEVTCRGRQALHSEPRLRPLNLFVSVKQGVATVSGPVPSEELARLAVQVLEKVTGIYEVRNQLSLVKVPVTQPLFIPLQNEPPTQTQSAFPDRRPGSRGTLAGRNGENLSGPGKQAGTNPFPETASNPFPLPRPPEVSPEGVALLPPVALSEGTRPSGQIQPEVDPLAVLRVGVEQLRRADRRFQPLHVEIRDAQTLWVYDDPWHGEDVAAFAEGLRRLPGVRSLVIKNPPLPVPR
jgi:BON domain